MTHRYIGVSVASNRNLLTVMTVSVPLAHQKANEIRRQLADAVTKGQHEYVLATHIDKGHIHNHSLRY